jgi:hypothetical protein
MDSLPPTLWQVVAGSEMDCQLHKLQCPQCSSYFDVAKNNPGLPSCIFELRRLSHRRLPPLFVCLKHSILFTLKRNLCQHISNVGCGCGCGDDDDDDDDDDFIPITNPIVEEVEEQTPTT